MQHAGAGICHMGDDGDEVQIVHEADGLFTAALQTECNDATGAVGQILLCQGIVLVAGQAGITDPTHLFVLLQPLCHLLGIGAMLAHAQGQGLQTYVQQEGVLGSGDAAQVAHQLYNDLRGVGHVAESGGVGKSVVTLVGFGQACELVVLGLPVEVAAIHYATAHLCGMAVHVLGGGVCDDVSAPLERTAVDGCGKGVVHDEGYTMLVCYACKALYIEDTATGVADCLAEEALCVGTELGFNALVVPVLVDEGALYAQFLQRYAEEVECAAIDVVGGYEMVACLADVEDGVEVGCLSG